MFHVLRRNLSGSTLLGIVLLMTLFIGSIALAASAEQTPAPPTFRVTLTVEVPGAPVSVYSFPISADRHRGTTFRGLQQRLVPAPVAAAQAEPAEEGSTSQQAAEPPPLRLRDAFTCQMDLEQRIGGVLRLTGNLGLDFVGQPDPSLPAGISPPTASVTQDFVFSTRPGKTVVLLETDSARTGSVSVKIRVDPVPD